MLSIAYTATYYTVQTSKFKPLEFRVSVAARRSDFNSAIEEPKDEKSRNTIIVHDVAIANCLFIIATSRLKIKFSISPLRGTKSPNFNVGNVVLQLKLFVSKRGKCPDASERCICLGLRGSCDYSQRRRRKRFDWRNNSAKSIDSRSLGQISHGLVTFVSVGKRFLLPRISHVDPRLLDPQLVSLDHRTV